MPELLIELFSEEIPARMQARAAEELCGSLLKALSPLMTAAPRPLFGPRRIAAGGEMAARAETPRGGGGGGGARGGGGGGGGGPGGGGRGGGPGGFPPKDGGPRAPPPQGGP